jgi:hypothetical protein
MVTTAGSQARTRLENDSGPAEPFGSTTLDADGGTSPA